MSTFRVTTLATWTLASLIGLVACAGGETPPPSAPPPPPPPPEKPAGFEDTKADPEAKAEPKYDVDLVWAKESPPVKKAPRLAMDGPGIDQFIPAHIKDNYKVRYKVKNWADMPEGSYIQFVWDNRPFRAVTDPKEKITFTDLAAPEQVTKGEHIIAMYVVRKNHEAIKSERGILVRRFFVGARPDPKWKSRDPMIIVGRPWGTYEGPAGNDILIDWYLMNVELANKGHNVRMILKGPGIPDEGIKRSISEWKPYQVLSAHEGEYTVKIDLIDEAGEVAKGPWNENTRTFKVVKPSR